MRARRPGERRPPADLSAALVALSGGVLLCLAAGCARGCTTPPATPSGRASSLEWAFDGCAEVRAGPVCEVEGDAPIRVWARPSTGRLVEPEHPGLVVASTAAVDGGTRWTLRSNAGRGSLQITAVDSGRPIVATLQVHRVAQPRCPIELADFEAATDEVLDDLERRIEATGDDVRSQCWSDAGRRAQSHPRWFDRGFRWLSTAQRAFEREGRLRSWSRAAGTQAYMLIQANRADESKALLDGLVWTATVGEGLRLPLLSTRAYADENLSNLAGARRTLELALSWSNRLDAGPQWIWAARFLLPIYERLGDHRRAERLALELLAKASSLEPPCAAKGALAAVHWWSLFRRTAALRAIDAPIAATLPTIDLDALRARMSDGIDACPILRTEVATNLALEALLLRRPDDADAHLRTAESWLQSSDATARSEAWVADARSAWEFEVGRPRAAIQRIEAIERDAFVPPALAWTLATRRAEAYRRLDDPARADAAWQRAAELIDRWPDAVELDRSFSGMTTRFQRAAQAQVQFLVAEGRVAAAIDVARWARTRALLAARRSDKIEALEPALRRRWDASIAAYLRLQAQLDEVATPTSDAEAREAAQRRTQLQAAAESQLRAAREILWASSPAAPRAPPPPGTLFLVLYPGRSDWLLLTQDSNGSASEALARLDASRATLESKLQAALARLDASIERASSIRVTAVGLADRVDVHAIRWRGAPLLQAKAVVYGLDVDPSTPGPPRERRALIVADPSANDSIRRLPAARDEAADVEQLLLGRGWRVETLLGEAVTRASLARALPTVTLFHFAGHARSPTSKSERGLELAAARYFKVGDVLALSAAPEIVILAACDSGVEQDSPSLGPDLGIAQAFVLAGATVVVATSRAVDDGVASDISRALHRRAPYQAREAALAIGRASRDLTGDWAAFRVFVP